VARRSLLPCFVACLLLYAEAIAAERWTIGLSTSGASIEAVEIAGRSASVPTVLLVAAFNNRISPATQSPAKQRASNKFRRTGERSG
jgi:hypothetical protein